MSDEERIRQAMTDVCKAMATIQTAQFAARKQVVRQMLSCAWNTLHKAHNTVLQSLFQEQKE